MELRDAEMKDAKQLDRMLERLIREESRYDGNLRRDCHIQNNYCDRIGMDGHKLILIEDCGEILGYLYGFVCHVPGIYQSPIGIVDALFVEEKHRRKGYASMLISAFKEFAKENGACRVELKVVSDNEPAVALYKKLSFTETRKYMKLGL